MSGSKITEIVCIAAIQDSLKIILGSSGVKELPRLKTHTSLLVPTRYKLKELEVCSLSQSKIGDVSVASIRELQVEKLKIMNSRVNIIVEPFG